MYLDKYGKKNAAISGLSVVSIGETVVIDSRKFGGLSKFRNALNYFMRRNEGMKFSTKVGYPDKDMVYVKRIS